MTSMPLQNEILLWHRWFFSIFPEETAAMASNILAATAPEKILGAEMFGPAARAKRAS